MRQRIADIISAVRSEITFDAVPYAKTVCIIYAKSRKEVVPYHEISKPLNFQIFPSSFNRKIPSHIIPPRLSGTGERPMNPNGNIYRL